MTNYMLVVCLKSLLHVLIPESPVSVYCTHTPADLTPPLQASVLGSHWRPDRCQMFCYRLPPSLFRFQSIMGGISSGDMNASRSACTATDTGVSMSSTAAQYSSSICQTHNS